jgi:plastocyanin
MRKMLMLVAALGVVAFAPAAQAAQATAKAATVTITITKAGVVPSQTKISLSDSVTWMNTDAADHQLVSDEAGLASPVLHSGQSFTFTFTKTGNFALKDALDKKLKAGTVVVANATTAPQAGAATVSLTASSMQAVYNTPVTLSGSISSQQAGEKVTVQAQRYGENKFADLATVTTAAGGTWSYTARPTIRTVFQSEYGKKTSAQVTVGVRPLVTFHVLTGNRFSTKVVAARSFAGKLVQFQKRSKFGQWVTLKRVKLSSSSAAIFKANLPKGNSTLRIAFSVNQAGAGYLGGMSRTVSYHRG